MFFIFSSFVVLLLFLLLLWYTFIFSHSRNLREDHLSVGNPTLNNYNNNNNNSSSNNNNKNNNVFWSWYITLAEHLFTMCPVMAHQACACCATKCLLTEIIFVRLFCDTTRDVSVSVAHLKVWSSAWHRWGVYSVCVCPCCPRVDLQVNVFPEVLCVASLRYVCNGIRVGVWGQGGDREIQGCQMVCGNRESNPGLRN